jgi:hypothetical protein
LIKFDPKFSDFSDVNITSSWDKGFIYVHLVASNGQTPGLYGLRGTWLTWLTRPAQANPRKPIFGCLGILIAKQQENHKSEDMCCDKSFQSMSNLFKAMVLIPNGTIIGFYSGDCSYPRLKHRKTSALVHAQHGFCDGVRNLDRSWQKFTSRTWV